MEKSQSLPKIRINRQTVRISKRGKTLLFLHFHNKRDAAEWLYIKLIIVLDWSVTGALFR